MDVPRWSSAARTQLVAVTALSETPPVPPPAQVRYALCEAPGSVLGYQPARHLTNTERAWYREWRAAVARVHPFGERREAADAIAATLEPGDDLEQIVEHLRHDPAPIIHLGVTATVHLVAVLGQLDDEIDDGAVYGWHLVTGDSVAGELADTDQLLARSVSAQLRLRAGVGVTFHDDQHTLIVTGWSRSPGKTTVRVDGGDQVVVGDPDGLLFDQAAPRCDRIEVIPAGNALWGAQRAVARPAAAMVARYGIGPTIEPA